MKVSNPIHKAMLSRIRRKPNWVFSATDFRDLGSRAAVDKALSRLAATDSIRRIIRGLFYVPQQHPVVGLTSPDVEQVAKKLVERSGVRLQPTGAYAANALGLCEQVPAKVVFLTDGPSRHIRIGRLDIKLRHTSPRMLATSFELSGLIIQALRYLGKRHVDQNMVRHLARRLPAPARKKLLKDVAYAPEWIGDIMRQLAASE